jgi:hypothetical protein
MSETKISREVAEEEFARFCEAHGIETDKEEMNEKTYERFLLSKKRFLKAVMEGRLAVDGEKLVYTFSRFSQSKGGEKIEISVPPARMFLEATNAPTAFQQEIRLISSMTGKSPSYFEDVDLLDFNFFEGVAFLFLSK